MSTLADVKKNTEQRMHKSLDALKTDLSKVRTGRAHAGLLDHISVDYYGSQMPIPKVANVSLLDARTLGVSPWEKKMLGAIEKAIRESNHALKELLKGKAVSEDEERRAQDEIQRLTDKHITEIDKMIAAKEAELMAV